MVELIVLTISVIALFIAVGWFSHYRSQQRAKAFENELATATGENDDNNDFHQRFDAVFEKEMHQTDFDLELADDEPHISISNEGLTATERSGIDNETSEVVEEPNDEALHDSQNMQQQAEQESAVADWDMVIALTIMAPDNSAFPGKLVKQVLDDNDMHFGDMHIYHRYTSSERRQVLFSVANILDPGTLVPQQLASSTTPGLLIFARLPGPLNGMALFDELLTTAQSMNAALGGLLSDDRRRPLNDEGLEEMRSRIFNYNLALQQESSQRSDDYFN